MAFTTPIACSRTSSRGKTRWTKGSGSVETETNGRLLGVELDLDQLLRMDQKSMIDMLAAGVTGAIFSPDEARQRVNLGQVKGGRVPYLQQQNFSLEALGGARCGRSLREADAARDTPPVRRSDE